MKKVLFILLCISSSAVFAQSSFGVKAGLNYGDNGKIEFSDFTGAGENVINESGDNKVGYHLGAYYRFDLGPLFLKPELLYTETKSSYNFQNREADFKVSKLDLPVLVGIDVFGPVHIFAGPSLQYLMGNDFDGFSIEEMENEFTMGAQFGVGIQLRGLGIDFRYERGLTSNEADFAQDNLPGTYRFDSRPNQFILALSLDL